ncbi:MAG: hypothetical protein BWX67_00020 [Thermotogae bacterium ADurb.Bin062]|nr:MAG: hypothetical protein BWX67_00020 [Thermotogota bacterium ADurb.Bin062]
MFPGSVELLGTPGNTWNALGTPTFKLARYLFS